MPDSISHSLFANRILKELDFCGKESSAAYPHLFRAGSQGADILYYCEYVKKGNGFYSLADALHEKDEGLVLAQINESRPLLSPAAEAYLLGFAAHYCLDGEVHPFVYGLQKRVARTLGVSEDCAHVVIESTFEARELFEARGVTPKKFNCRENLPKNKAECETVARAIGGLSALSSNTPPDEHTLALALRRLPFLFSLLFDKSGAANAAMELVRSLKGRYADIRWHVKRAYDGEFFGRVFTEADYAEYERLTDAAFRRCGKLLKGFN